MSRKADPSSRRSPRRRPAAVVPENTPAPRKPAADDSAMDSDFGLALALAPALRRRSDA